MREDAMTDEILKMLKELRPEYNFADSDDFIEDELLDSFDIISLVSMLEEKYSIVIDALDIKAENFQQPEDIERLLYKSKRTDGLCR